MTLVDFSTSLISLLPPAVALGMAILTRRVLLSLGIGILLGAFLLTDYSLFSSLGYIQGKVYALVVEDGAINSWNMSIIGFLLLLGMMTAMLTLSGGTRAFALWAQKKVKGNKGAQLLAAFLGVFIFVDDYFNSLAVGSISRPVTDRFGVSRAKLAYILDSTAAPMCIIMPASSWGAYIMTIIGGILVSHGMTEYTPLNAYIQLIPMNFYAIFALLMVFAMIVFQLDIGSMKQHELGVASGIGRDDQAIELKDELNIQESESGSVNDLIVPIVALVVATVAAMIFTGWQSLAADDKAFSILGAFENTDVGMSLIDGGLVGLLISLISVFRQRIPAGTVLKTLLIGMKSMFGAILVLFFAWTIGAVIKDMQTGVYLSSMAQGNVPVQWLPAILFVLSGCMAFATGTSWGTFGIMLPIAGDIAGATELTLMMPMLAAVLAGSVFGDHCSPISDTTILSSTGARCNHIDHVATQLPYALLVAFISLVGYIVLGLSDSVSLSLVVTFAVFAGACFIFRIRQQSRETLSDFA
ncbi:Na+/H+ antiporter NhaC family protein [Vibrio mangrovi]|uniref:Malate-2H(+)/Na(+)-lactate antiporter n=1 Tax=Vibrio mangrovi TaxID=474394 RepID=A0A1Y6IMK8_9VIBR|nr:Na+/H+ antiporter NhaC family protein [Vibrio mangrovi]MDW6004297.1 Na+/H+ antiporter NhaC family protein [Vibrio mangrovi]SMR98904.1 Malate-2H(+)/Na(+)-lactate antiporter [Vibrio mangrovi]